MSGDTIHYGLIPGPPYVLRGPFYRPTFSKFVSLLLRVWLGTPPIQKPVNLVVLPLALSTLTTPYAPFRPLHIGSFAEYLRG